MKYPPIYYMLLFIIFHQPLFGQNESILTDSIYLPYSVTNLKIRERQTIKVLILQATTDSLLVTPIRNWQRIRGKTRSLASIAPVLLPIYGEKEKIYPIPYADLEELKVVTTMRNPNRKPHKVWRGAIMGAGGSAVGSTILGSLIQSISCLGTEEECEKLNVGSFVIINTIIGGAIGAFVDYSIDMKMNISIGKNIKQQTNQEWQEAMREYSILR